MEERVECASGSDPFLLYKTLHLLFFLLIRIPCALRLESRKKLSICSWCGTFEIAVSWAEGMSRQSIQNSVALFRVTDKTPGLISYNNFVKKFLSASAIAIMTWQDVTRSSVCSGVKQCGTKRAHNFLFPKSFSESEELQSLGSSKILLSFLMRFDRHFWPNQQQQQCLPQSRFWTATSLVIFYQLPSVSKSRIPPKNVWSVQSLIPISLLHQY